jgi:hypothetical protein
LAKHRDLTQNAGGRGVLSAIAYSRHSRGASYNRASMRLHVGVICVLFSCLAITGKGLAAKDSRRASGSDSMGKATHTSTSPRNVDVIKPGIGVGNLKIGATRDQALASRSDPPGTWQDDCGEVLTWSATSRSGVAGTLIARLRNGVVVQIDSANSAFHTAEGITADSRPEVVRERYKQLRAYASDITDMALGDKPVVYWIDTKKGIGFEFAYFPEERRRYLYAVIVFRVDGDLCPDGNKPDPQHWHEIAPY